MYTFKFTPKELEENRQGRLSDRQKAQIGKMLRNNSYIWAVVIILVFIMILNVVFTLIEIDRISHSARIYIILWSMVCLFITLTFWVWYGKKKVTSKLSIKRSIGRIRLEQDGRNTWCVTADGKRLILSGKNIVLKSGEPYEIYFINIHILSAYWLNDSPFEEEK